MLNSLICYFVLNEVSRTQHIRTDTANLYCSVYLCQLLLLCYSIHTHCICMVPNHESPMPPCQVICIFLQPENPHVCPNRFIFSSLSNPATLVIQKKEIWAPNTFLPSCMKGQIPRARSHCNCEFTCIRHHPILPPNAPVTEILPSQLDLYGFCLPRSNLYFVESA